MSAFTSYGNNLMLSNLFNNSATPFYLALLTAVPDSNATSATISEPSGYSYTRVVINAGSSYWVYGQSGVYNAYKVVFSTASGNWGRIVGWALCDASTGGNVYACGELSQNLVVQSGNTVTLPAQALSIRLL